MAGRGLRGPVTAASPGESQADLHARSTGALAAALTGHQSEVLESAEALREASRSAWDRAAREPDAPAPTWTLYRLVPEEAEFFQGEGGRRHVRMQYRRAERGWTRRLLWP